MKQFDVEEQIICAIREKGAKNHLANLEREIVARRKRNFMYTAVAASLLLMLTVGFDMKLSHDVRSVGYAFNPVEGQSGGSEITALMQDKNISEALIKISEARGLIDEQRRNPTYEDAEYMAQLEIDTQELDFLEAVCYMRQGKYFKARRYLRIIALNEGHFSSEAQKLLGEL